MRPAALPPIARPPRGSLRFGAVTRWLAALALATGGLITTSGPVAAAGISFNRDVRPILSDNCFACHGPAEDRGGDLRLDVRDEAIADRGGSAAIVPGRPEASEILRRIRATDPDEVMPPPRAKKHRLSDRQLAILERWIAEGADYQGHWAFQPLAAVEPPAPPAGWGHNGIDGFIAAELTAAGLAPSAEAEPEVLLRRVSLDLVGLQPTPEELQAFLADRSPDAYERAVDRLLASPHYGERWARHWLDQARYADSHGYSIDSPRAMWPWRDWVIRALNEDMPFDRFTIEQLAGDLLPQATKLQRIATGFHRNSMINEEGGSKPEQFRNEVVVDRVNTTGAVWLGLTVGCAQCHTHKYDPLTHTEYFRLFGFFNGDTDVNNVADTLEVVRGEIVGQAGDVDARAIAEAGAAVARARAGDRSRLADWLADWPATGDAAAPANEWTVARPLPVDEAQPTIAGATLEADGVTLAIDAGDTAELTVSLPDFTAPVRAVRLEFPGDPESGSVAHAADGTFVVSDVSLLTRGGDRHGVMKAFASGEQKNATARLAIDDAPATGWTATATAGGAGLVIVPRERIPSDSNLRMTIRFAAGKGRVPRRLRISTTTQEHLAPLDPAAADVLGRAIAAAHGRGTAPPEKAVLAAFATVDTGLAAAEFDRDALRRRTTLGQSLVMRALPEPRRTFVHLRGDYLNPDTKLGPLEPGTPAFLPPLGVEAGRPATRLDLARWLVRPDNPLTPRVAVNRVWMRFFGAGLVDTENDFGTQGSPPTHPELLDWLAGRFIADGWSMKTLHRLIVTSATYRQASVHRDDLAARDPRNTLLGRQNRVRLDAEVIRDQALLAGGLLAAELGGPSVHPPQPDGVFAFTQTRKAWPTATGPQRFRRTLYTQFYRSAPHPLLTTFDAPNFSQACTRRTPSNTPLQSLMLANDEIFVEAAAAIGDRVAAVPAPAGGAATAARIERMFALCLARRPSDAERSLAETFLASQVGPEAGPEAWGTLARGLLNTDNFVTRE